MYLIQLGEKILEASELDDVCAMFMLRDAHVLPSTEAYGFSFSQASCLVKVGSLIVGQGLIQLMGVKCRQRWS